MDRPRTILNTLDELEEDSSLFEKENDDRRLKLEPLETGYYQPNRWLIANEVEKSKPRKDPASGRSSVSQQHQSPAKKASNNKPSPRKRSDSLTSSKQGSSEGSSDSTKSPDEAVTVKTSTTNTYDDYLQKVVRSVSSMDTLDPLSMYDEKTRIKNSSIDYDSIIREHVDLSRLTFVNESEKYVISRIYSNLSRLSAYLDEMKPSEVRNYLNTPDDNDCLPLYYAIKIGSTNTISHLLKLGASLNRTTSEGDPAAHLACLLGSPISLIDFILSYDPSQTDLYKTDQEGWTILHCACNQGHLEIVKYLVETRHMNLNFRDHKGQYTGLHLAVMNNRMNVVEYLLSFATTTATTMLRAQSARVPSQQSVRRCSKEEKEKFDSTLTRNGSILNSSERCKSSITSSHEKALSLNNIQKVTMSAHFAQVVNSSVLQNYKSKQQSRSSSKKSKSKKESVSSNSVVITDPVKHFVHTKPAFHLEPISVYNAANKSQVLPISVFNNRTINLNLQNNEGQNSLHLACRYGNVDAVRLLLEKYGSNELNVNMIDFKGQTCLDLAWEWILNLPNLNALVKKETTNKPPTPRTSPRLNSSMSSSNKSSSGLDQLSSVDEIEKKANIFYDAENSFFVQLNNLIVNHQIDNELKLVHMLVRYGAKFSTHDKLMFDIASLKTLDPKEVNLPSNLFHPFDHIPFYQLRLQSENLLSINTYLKALLFVLRLNLTTLFLNSTTMDAWAFTEKMTKEFARNLHDLVQFIKTEVIDSFEKNLYYDSIKEAFEHLSKIRLQAQSDHVEVIELTERSTHR